MIKIQHWKVYHVHFGLIESEISSQLMKGISIQLIEVGMGVPISKESLIKANSPDTSRYVNSYISIILCEFLCTVLSYRVSINHTCRLYCFTLPILYIMWTDMLHLQNWDGSVRVDEQSTLSISTYILQRNIFCQLWTSKACFVFQQLCLNGWPISKSIH